MSNNATALKVLAGLMVDKGARRVVLTEDAAELLGNGNVIFAVVDQTISRIRIAAIAPSLPGGVDFGTSAWVFHDDVRDAG